MEIINNLFLLVLNYYTKKNKNLYQILSNNGYPDLVIISLMKNGLTENLRDDFQIVKLAVQKDGLNLQYASVFTRIDS